MTSSHTDAVRPFPRIGGFTLIELLVASVVSIILLGILFAALQGISSNYTRTQANIIRQGDASFALDQIVQDLEGYVIPNFSAGEAVRVTPEKVGDSTNAIWLTLLTTATDKDNSSPEKFTGATRAVSYRLARQSTIDADSTGPSEPYAIYRAISPAKHVFENVTATTTNMQAQYWANIPASPAPTPAQPTAIGNMLSENVVAFTVRFLKPDGVWTSSDDELRIGHDGTTINGAPLAGGFKRAEVSIPVLSPEGIQQLKNGLPFREAVTRFGLTAVRQTAFFQSN